MVLDLPCASASHVDILVVCRVKHMVTWRSYPPKVVVSKLVCNPIFCLFRTRYDGYFMYVFHKFVKISFVGIWRHSSA